MNSNQGGLIWLMSPRSTRLASAMAMSASDRPNLTESRLSANDRFRPIAVIKTRRHTALMTSSLLGSLVGEELSGIGFIRDYVELYFDGPVLRLMGQVSHAPSDGPLLSLESRLVALIGSRVTAVGETVNALKIEFSSGASVHLQADHGAPEYAHLIIVPDNQLVVWQTE